MLLMITIVLNCFKLFVLLSFVCVDLHLKLGLHFLMLLIQ